MKLLIKSGTKNKANMKFDVIWETVSPLFLWYNFPYFFSSLNLVSTEIIKSKKLYILENCKEDCHLKKDTAICDSFVKHSYMHTLILFTRSMLQGHVKKTFLNIEYLESLQDLVLRKKKKLWN